MPPPQTKTLAKPLRGGVAGNDISATDTENFIESNVVENIILTGVISAYLGNQRNQLEVKYH